MSEFIFIADFFVDEILGGGELNNDELIKIIDGRGHEIKPIKSSFVDELFLESNKGTKFIVSNFALLSEKAKKHLFDLEYIIYEHDHKYLTTRNPADFPEFKAPPDKIINYEFYKNARAVMCQTSFHKSIVERNLELPNIISLGGNLWSEETLGFLLEISSQEKKDVCSIMSSNNWHKNTAGAVAFCQARGIEYELIPASGYYDFLTKLGNNKKLVFFPKTPETLSRVVVEARMAGMSVTTNNLVGATKEDWFSLKGEELIKKVKTMRGSIVDIVLEALNENTFNIK